MLAFASVLKTIDINGFEDDCKIGLCGWFYYRIDPIYTCDLFCKEINRIGRNENNNCPCCEANIALNTGISNMEAIDKCSEFLRQYFKNSPYVASLRYKQFLDGHCMVVITNK